MKLIYPSQSTVFVLFLVITFSGMAIASVLNRMCTKVIFAGAVDIHVVISRGQLSVQPYHQLMS